MLFTEGRFFLFLALVLALHWGLRSHRLRKLWLLGASYAFYAGWDYRFLGLIWLSTAVDYTCGRVMAKRETRAERRPWLIASLVANLSILGFFKYFGFFVESATTFAGWLGLDVSPITLHIVLPVGISFYTFQTMSYSLDVYRGRMGPMRNLADFALFVAFFPQLVAGPIVRAVEFRPQLEEPRRFAKHVDLRFALTLFLSGFVKKACVADGIAGIVDPVFADPTAYTSAATWLTVALYHIQIYCDFSGYSEMAIAIAALLGYRLPDNFAFPYFARGIGEFWRKWHITLATWLRDYLFLPLVGRSPSQRRRLFALLLTFSACGLWHGAGWGFAGFGTLHGIYLVIEELWQRSRWRKGIGGRVSAVLGAPLLTLAVLLTWPVFRVETVEGTLAVFANLAGRATGELAIGSTALWILVGFTAVHWIAYRGCVSRWAARLPDWTFPVWYGFAWSMVLPWVATEAVPFIYFQF